MKQKKNIPYGHQSIDTKDIDAVVKTLKSDWMTQGPEVKAFEDALCRYTGAKYAVAVSSGTAALHIACLAAGLQEGDEAVTSPITFVASANSILYCGAKPVFADICADTVNIDPRQIAQKITKRTKAVIPVHFAGQPCDMEGIRKISSRNKLIVIEDAAHAIGSQYKGSKIGSCEYSDMTTFSFHPLKTITTGEGGAVTTNDRRIYERLLLLRSHGITKDKTKLIRQDEGPWYHEMHELGFNFRMTDFQCALGMSQLSKLDDFVGRRQEIFETYRREFSGISDIVLPVEKGPVKSAWHLFYIRLKNPSRRRGVFESLQEQGIGVQVHYIPVYLQPYYQRLGYKSGQCPVAENYYNRTISVPLFPGMTKKNIASVVGAIHKVFDSGGRDV